MGIIFKTEKRRVIPKWRSLEISRSNGELKASSRIEIPKPFDVSLLKDQQENFAKNKNLQTAGDLLSGAFVLGLEQEFRDVADYILGKDSEGVLESLARKVLTHSENEIELKKSDRYIYDYSQISAEIQRFRSYLKKEPRNPIAWIELGRLYSLINKKEKAERCVTVALSLDKDNRFIVRSASRFFHHSEPDSERALSIIKNSKFINSDPWLMSAEIAYSSMYNRFSTMYQKGVDFIKHRSNNGIEITELASALGTQDFFDGKTKKAKSLFELSLMQPNDNSIAQAYWMLDEIQGLKVNQDSELMLYAFEANAINCFEKKMYKKAFEFAEKWIEDEPYSSRPIRLASYLSGIFLGNNEQCIRILKKGLIVNPDDVILNNNLVYFLINANQKEDAIKVYARALSNKKNNEFDATTKITLYATTGLLFYKDNLPEKGREYYEYAIKLAKSIQNEYLVALATVNYLNEEIEFSSNRGALDAQINYLSKYVKNNESPDVEILFDKLIKKLGNK